jgi:hypothetical protein
VYERIVEEERSGMRSRQSVRRYIVPIATAVVAIALSIAPASASATSPVLEFVTPGKAFPVSFTTESGPVNAEMAGFSTLVDCTASHGSGEVTGLRSAVAEYTFTGCTTEHPAAKCNSEGAGAEEIKTGPIEAELVYVAGQREVAMLLNPGKGIYMKFECGGELTEASGDFLAPGGPINQEATVFTLTLSQLGALQTPDEYETLSGERLPAVPKAKRGSHELATTGAEATFTVHTSVRVEVRVITPAEVEAGQRVEAQRKHDEEALRKREAEIKQEALNKLPPKKIHQVPCSDSSAFTCAAQLKPKSKHPTRAQLLAKALKRCMKEPKKKRAKCDAKAEKKYGSKTEKGKGQKGS